MRKNKLFFVLLAGMLCLTGCGEKEVTEDKQTPGVTESAAVTGTAEKDEETVQTIVSEEYQWGKNKMMNTDTGYYYYDYEKNGLCYYDNAAGKAMYLCNKPECRHDGNKFCVASNKDYKQSAHCLYSGKIYYTAWSDKEGEFSLKLMNASLDGSESNEVLTIYSTESFGPQMAYSGGEIVMHRNYAMVPIRIMIIEGTGTGAGTINESYYGAAVINLETKEVSFLDEKPVSLENEEVCNVSAYGDTFYFARIGRKKTTLHCYNFKEKTDETCKLLTNFSGSYAVLDEKTVAYIRKRGRKLCVHNLETGENTEAADFKLEDSVRPSIYSAALEASSIATDGLYLYVPMQTVSVIDEEEETVYAVVSIYDKNMELVNQVNVASMITNLPEYEWQEGEKIRRSVGFCYTGEVMYYEITSQANWYTYVYKLQREDFIAGEPKLEFIYKRIK